MPNANTMKPGARKAKREKLPKRPAMKTKTKKGSTSKKKMPKKSMGY